MLQLEVLALTAFAFVLPLFEVPKNLLWIIYSGLWLANRLRSRDFGGPWNAWDTLIALWIASGFVSAAFAGLHHNEWVSAVDVLRYASVLWMLQRSGYDEGQLRKVLAALVLGTLAGLAWGYYGVRVTGQNRFLGLNSVGHVNHSAIYVTIVFGAAIAWVRAAWATTSTARRVFGVVSCLVFALSLVVMESRATVGVGFVVAFLVVGVYATRSRKPLWTVLLGAVVIATALFAAKPEVVKKNALRLHENLFLAHRDAIWRAGFIAWRQYPVFGVGMGNYGRINFDRLEEWSRAQGETLDRASVLPQSHAHSLYLNTLVERGVTGLAALLAVLAAWCWVLVRHLPRAEDSSMRWAFWGGASSAWLVTVIVGAVNTTLHHEHALACMLLLGGWLALRRLRPAPPTPAVRA